MCTDFGFTPRSGIECELLRLYIMSGHDLAFGDGDMYVKINLLTNKGHKVGVSIVTEVDKDTAHPKWNEMFIVKVSPAEHKLQMQVYSRDDFLGLVEIPLSVKEVSREPSGIKFWEIIEGMRYDLKTECTKFDTKGQIEIYHAYISTYDQPIYEIRRQYKARGNTVSISQGSAQSHFYDP